MKALNNKVVPTILVFGKETRSLNYWSTNRFVDPVDNVPFLESDLNPEELGHIYLHKLTTDKWIQVHMPYRLMDSSTGRLIGGLRSFRSCSPYLNGSLPERQLKNPKSCLQTFRLDEEDFIRFSKRVNKLKGRLIEDKINSDKLSERIKQMCTWKDDIDSDLISFRDKACRTHSERFYTTEEDLVDSLQVFRSAREAVREFNEAMVPIALDIERLSKEVGRETVKTKISTEFSLLKAGQDQLRKLPIDRFEREAIHKSNVDLGKAEVINVPIHIRSLMLEVNELKAYYPCLSRLRVVSNTEVAIDLTGVDISLTDKTVVVRGDPGALSAYQGDNTTTDKGSNRRVRNIMTPVNDAVEEG